MDDPAMYIIEREKENRVQRESTAWSWREDHSATTVTPPSPDRKFWMGQSHLEIDNDAKCSPFGCIVTADDDGITIGVSSSSESLLPRLPPVRLYVHFVQRGSLRREFSFRRKSPTDKHGEPPPRARPTLGGQTRRERVPRCRAADSLQLPGAAEEVSRAERHTHSHERRRGGTAPAAPAAGADRCL